MIMKDLEFINKILIITLLIGIVLGYCISEFFIEFSDPVSSEVQDAREDVVNTASGGMEIPVDDPGYYGKKYIFPIASSDVEYTSPFGVRISPLTETKVFHNGLDICSVWKAQVVSVADGKVVAHWPPPGRKTSSGYEYKGHPTYGGMIEIEHIDGSRTLYAHMSETYVYEGMPVKAGRVIGRIGNTGKSTGPHLHFELEIDGIKRNPLLYINKE